MTARERVVAAMERRVPDRTPVIPCLWFDHVARVVGQEYAVLLASPEKMYDASFRARERYGADGMRAMIMPPLDWRAGTVLAERDGRPLLVAEDGGEPVAAFDLAGGGALTMLSDRHTLFDHSGCPVGMHIEDIGEVDKIPVFDAGELTRQGRTEAVRALAARVADRYFIIAFAGRGMITNPLTKWRGTAQGLMDLVDHPKLVRALSERCTDAAIEEAKAMIDAGVHGIFYGDSSASSSMISPDHYRRYCLPVYQRFVREVRAYASHVKIYQHCCGNYNPILETAAEAEPDGLHGMDPTQGMDIADIKRRVGDRVCVFGGVNTLTLLQGSAADVRQESLACIAAGGPGGFILDAACAVPPASPFDNVRAMCHAPRSAA